MRSARVVVTDLSGRGNKIFKSGDTVYERSFPAGNYDRLIAGGFIKEDVVEAEKAPVVEAEKDADIDGPHMSEGTGEELEGAEATADGNEHEAELREKTKEDKKPGKKNGKK